MINAILITLVISGMIMIALGLYSRNFRTVPARAPFAWMVYLDAAWCLIFALDGIITDPSIKLVMFQVVLGIVALVPITCLITILYLFGFREELTKWRLVGLLTVPFLIILINATNGLTSWFITGYSLIETAGFYSLALEYGPAFLIHSIYSYLIILATMALLLWHTLQTTGMYRWRDLIVLAGFSVPFMGNAIVLSGGSGGFDFTPILFVVTGLALTFALFRYQMLSLMPVARGVIMDISSDPILVLDHQGKVVDLNPAAMTILGLSSSSIGQNAATLFTGQKAMQNVLEGTTTDDRVVVLRTISGSKFYDCQVDEMMDSGDLPMGRVIILRDITLNKMAQDALMESEERYRAIFDQFLGSIFVVDITDGSVLQANQAFCDFVGCDEKEVTRLNTSSIDSIDGDLVRKIFDTVRGGGRFIEETTATRCNGKLVNIEISASPIRYSGRDAVCVMGWDITERRQVEANRERIEKLEATGTLAGGIAHDFNNLLTSVLGYVSLSKQRTSPGTETHEGLQEAEMAIMQAKEIAQELLSLAKGGSPICKPVSIPDLLKVTSNHPFLNSNVRCDLHIPPSAWFAYVDPGQIGRVFTNLFMNAKDAMPQGGTVHVSLANVQVGLHDHPPLKPGRFIEVTIRDEGIGISPEILPKIFEPYFTTKKKGYGLGLSVVYATVSRHNGSIEVDSQVGEGTTFRIYLPVTEDRPSECIAEENAMTRGQGRVLVMDDEEYILEVSAELLRAIGYQVGTARNGEEALAEYQRSIETGKRYDIVIMDLTNPNGMGGKEAVRCLLALDPRALVIVSSGYSNDPVMAEHRKYGFVGVLPKPYKIEELAIALKQTLSMNRTDPVIEEDAEGATELSLVDEPPKCQVHQ